MKLNGVTPTGPQPNGPQGAKPAKAAGEAFGAAFKRAASSLSQRQTEKSVATGKPGSVDAESAPVAAPTNSTDAGKSASGMPLVPAKSLNPAAATDGAAPTDHMELVKFRMRTGYYSSKNIDDALTDKLTGYFDDLAS